MSMSLCVIKKNKKQPYCFLNAVFAWVCSVLLCAELEVARMSTDGNLPDLKFPQTGGQGNSIHLSANTLKQHGRNGE